MALGVLAEAEYLEGRFLLEAGEKLLLYTDGATDARSPSGVLYGDDRLQAAVAQHAGSTPDALVAGVIKAIDDFAAGGPPEDDVTLLAVAYRG
jgi:phosphoserine phosphatase RsbU/P